jgi:hypothetical protein
MCLGMEPSLWFVENHWPPLGVDGRPVKNFEALRWGYLATDTYGGETRGSAMGWNASVRSCSLDTRTVTSDAARQEAGALWSIPAKGLAVARSLHKRTDDLAPLYILPSIIFGIPTLLLVVRNSFPKSRLGMH